MDQTARLPLGGRRWQRYEKTLRFTGVDLTGADMRLQVRLYRNAPGTPVIDLLTVTNGNAQGIRLISVDEVDGRSVSTVGIIINETTMEGTPYMGEAGADSVFAYDLQINPAGGFKQVWAEGEFWVLAAVTGADSATPSDTIGSSSAQRQRPNFSPAPSQFQIGDTITTVELSGGQGPRGESGSTQHVTFVATEGQTTFPATGTFTVDDAGDSFSYSQGSIAVYDGTRFLGYGVDYTAPGGVAPIVLASGVPADTVLTVYAGLTIGIVAPTAVTLLSDEVDVASYPGTTIEEDPFRLDHDNVRYQNAQIDVTTVGGENFGKAARFFRGRGSGTTLSDASDPTIGSTGSVPAYMRAAAGDWLLDAWSVNGTVIRQNDGSVVVTPNPNETGNVLPGVVVRWEGAAFRRPPRDLYPEGPRDFGVLRPYIFSGEPPLSAGTVDSFGVVEVSDYFVGNKFEGRGTLKGENFRRGYNENANDFMLSGATDCEVEVIGYASSSDVVHWGSSALGPSGGGNEQRRCRNKGCKTKVTADGLNRNNRNVVSIINGDGMKTGIRARRFTKAGGAAALDAWNPNTGVSAPSPFDGEPNAFFERKPFIANTDTEVYAEDCGGGAALLLPDNNSFPNSQATQNHKVKVTAVRCDRGYIQQGGNKPARPYNIEVDLTAIDCLRPYEILSGGARLKVFALNCTQAAYHGYFATACADLHLTGEFVNCGAASGVTIENRGWDGGSMQNVKFTNCPTIAIRHFPQADSSQITQNLVIDNVDFGAGLTFPQYVDVGAVMKFGSIFETRVRYNADNPNQSWRAVGAPVRSIPGSGLYKAGQELIASPLNEPGWFRTIRAIATNLSGPPSFVIQDEIGGLAPYTGPNAGTLASFTKTNMMVNDGRATATGVPAVARYTGTAINTAGMNGLTPGSGTSTVYVGVTGAAFPTGPADILFGIWFGDTSTGYVARAVLAGSPAGTSKTFKRGDFWNVTSQRNGTSTVTVAGTPLHTTSLPNSPFYPVILIMTAGETITITGVSP